MYATWAERNVVRAQHRGPCTIVVHPQADSPGLWLLYLLYLLYLSVLSGERERREGGRRPIIAPDYRSDLSIYRRYRRYRRSAGREAPDL